jgi:hypothetical protein
VISSDHRPLQFNMGELSNASTIYDKKGKGWINVDKQNFFLSGDPCDNNATQPLMTTSHQFEENVIILETMSHIKKNISGKNMKKFCVRCYHKNYQRGNETIRKRHKLIFKDTVNHHHDFPATNEFVETLDFDFVNRLKSGLWTKSPNDWLSNIR